MEVKVKYFGMLEELTGASEEYMEVPAGSTTSHVLELLERKYPGLKDRCARMALDGELVQEERPIQANSLLALMPPFAGG